MNRCLTSSHRRSKTILYTCTEMAFERVDEAYDRAQFNMIRMKLILVCWALLFLSGCASVQTTSQPSSLEDRIESYLADSRETYGIVGHSVVILRNGEQIHSSSDGLASIELGVEVTDETVFQVFSVAKLFVHVTIMQLREAGYIELDAEIGRYIDTIPSAWRSVTIRQLLSHTSGLPEYYRWPDHPTPESSQDALRAVFERPFEFESGSATQYNQTNYLLLGMIIETVTSEDFVSVMTDRMIGPPGLSSTSYGGEFAIVPQRATMYRATEDGVRRNLFIDQPNYMSASTGLNSTAADLAAWFSDLLAFELVSWQGLEEMWSPIQLTDGRVARFANGWEYSLGEDGQTAVGHGGGNRADVRHFIKGGESVTVIYLSNGSEKDFWPGQISYDLAEIVFAAA